MQRIIIRPVCSCSSRLPRRSLATLVDGVSPASQSSSSSSLSTAEASNAVRAQPTKTAPIDYGSRRAPQPSNAETAGQPVFLPNLVFRLVRNSPKERNNPYIATFRVPLGLTKPDIVSYLYQVYGLEITSISTIVEMGEPMKAAPGTYKASGRAKQTKKAIVGLKDPFWYPERRSDKWLDDNFERTTRKEYLTRKLMPVGDGSMGRGRRSWRWRGSDIHVQGLGSRYSEVIKRIQERRTQQEQIVKNLADKERDELVQRWQGLSVSGNEK